MHFIVPVLVNLMMKTEELQMLKCHKMVPQNQIHLVQGNKFITLSLTLLFRNEILNWILDILFCIKVIACVCVCMCFIVFCARAFYVQAKYDHLIIKYYYDNYLSYIGSINLIFSYQNRYILIGYMYTKEARREYNNFNLYAYFKK